jgi:hypothetical protein
MARGKSLAVSFKSINPPMNRVYVIYKNME